MLREAEEIWLESVENTKLRWKAGDLKGLKVLCAVSGAGPVYCGYACQHGPRRGYVWYLGEVRLPPHPTDEEKAHYVQLLADLVSARFNVAVEVVE